MVPRERMADVGLNPGTLLEWESGDRAQPRVQRPGERTADIGSNPGTLMGRVSSDRAQPRGV